MKALNKAKSSHILQTGVRLLSLMQLLYKGPAAKSEVAKFFLENFKFKKYSGATIQLDVNTLIKLGFKIKRTGTRETFRYKLEEKPVFQMLNDDESEILILMKNASTELASYGQILKIRNFLRGIQNYIPEKFKYELFDFGFLNCINPKTVSIAEKIMHEKKLAIISYNSSTKGRAELTGRINEILYRNKKLYFDIITEENELISLRADKIKSVKTASLNKTINDVKEEKITYTVKKEFIENYPLLSLENAVFENEKGVVILTNEKNKFFIVQRILYLGENCVEIHNTEIKRLVKKVLRKASGVYR